MKNALLILFLLISLSSVMFAQADSVYWPGKTQGPSIIGRYTCTSVGNVTGDSMRMADLDSLYGGEQGTYIAHNGSYTNTIVGDPESGTTPTTIYPRIDWNNLTLPTYPGQAGAGWPTLKTDTLNNIWVQYKVSPNSGYYYQVNSLSFDISAAGNSTMRAKAYISTDPYFRWKTEIYNTGANLASYSFSRISVTGMDTAVNSGQTFFIRVYPWQYNTSSLSTGKRLLLRNITIRGTAYTTSAPTVTTTNASNISGTGATSGGNVTLGGGYTITARGVCWNTSGTPTTADSYTSDGTGTGSFTSTITGLTPGATYYIRAYATNSLGTSYGDQDTLTTNSVYYNYPDADITQTGNWGTNTDGSGSNPSDFTANATYNLFNSGATMDANWTVGGENSNVVIGDGSAAQSFTIPAAYTLSGTVNVSNNATLTIQSTTLPTLGTIGATSTIAFDGASALQIPAKNYGNLTSSNDASATRTLASSGTIGIAGTFTPGSATYTITGSTVSFNGTSAQNIPAFTFNNLTTANSAGCTINGNVNVNGSCSVNQNLTVDVSQTLALTDTSAQLTVASGKSLTVNGILDNQSKQTVTLNGTMTVASGATYRVNADVSNSYSIPLGTYSSGSTIEVLQGAPRLNASISGNLVWNSVGTGILPNVTGLTIGGNLTVSNGAIYHGTTSSGRALTVSGNLIVSGGDYYIAGGGATYTATSSVTVNGNVTVSGGSLLGATAGVTAGSGTVNIKGNVTISGDSLLANGPGATTGAIILNGTSSQSLTGSNTYKLGFALNNTAGAVASSALSIESLTLTAGNLDMSGQSVTITSMTGTNGTISQTQALNAPSSANVGSLGALITSGADLGSTIVKRGFAAQSGASHTGAKRWYDITPTTNTGLNATLVFPYEVSDLNGIAEENLRLFKSTDDGATWVKMDTTYVTLDTAANTLTMTGIDGFSRWTLGDANAPLPVQLLELTATTWGLTAQLSWSTATEVSNYGFEVERRAVGEGKEWQKIGFVAGAGASNSPKQYSYKDKAAAGNYVYRLKQIDNDNTYKYSKEIEAMVGAVAREFKLYNAYPNPFNPSANIQFSFEEDGIGSLKIYNILGQLVATVFNGQVVAGQLYEETFNASRLASGLYFARLESANKVKVQKLLLTK